MKHKIVIEFSAYGTKRDICDVKENLVSNYTEFSGGPAKEAIRRYDSHSEIFIRFVGTWDGDVEDAVKLTHHAEALYENTSCEYVHVEVQLDDQWYGRNMKSF